MRLRASVVLVLALVCLCGIGLIAQTVLTDRQKVLGAIELIATVQPTSSTGQTNKQNILTRLNTLLGQVPLDPVCNCAPLPPPPPPPPPPTVCADGLDNDSDGLIDLTDPGCVDAADTDETNVVVVIPPPPPPTSLLFASGWQNTTEVGCTYAGLIDRVWDDYGGSGACSGTVHDADIVTNVWADGGRSLRVTQKPGFINGTDFRIVKVFGAQTEITAVWKVFYSPNWRWASADHKIVIFTDAQATAQNVYVNWRGGRDAQHARVAVHVIPSNTVLTDASVQATVGRWYRFRVHLVAGGQGRVAVWLTDCGVSGTDAACAGATETSLALVHDAGTAANPNNLNVGQIGGIKPDTTYNAGGNITELMYQYYDSIAVYRGLFNN